MFNIWRQEGHPANSEVRQFQSFVLLQQNPHHHMAGSLQYINSVKIMLGTWNIGMLNVALLEMS